MADTLTQNNQVVTPDTTSSPVTSVPASSIQPSSPITVPPASNPDLSVGLIGQNGNDVAAAQTQVNNQSDVVNSNLSNYSSLLDQLSGKTADTQTLQNQFGTPDLQKTINDLNSTAQQQQALYLQGVQNINQKAISQEGRDKGLTEATRQNGIDSLISSSLVSAAQNKLTFANTQVDRALALKYDTIVSKIDAQNKILADNMSLLTASQQRLATAKQNQLEAQKNQVLNQQALTKDAITAVQDAISKSLINPQDGFKTVSDLVSGKMSASAALYQLGLSSNSPSNLPPEQQSALKANGFTGFNTQTQDLATQLVNGNLAPSEASKRATGAVSYNNLLVAANKYSLATTGKPFNIAQADRDYKFAQRPQTQDTLNYIGSLVGTNNGSGQFTGGNMDELVALSNQIPRGQFPPLNDVQSWAKLSSGDVRYAQYQAVSTEVADQVAKILQGGGNGTSDAKLQQAVNLFNTGYSKEQLQGVIEALKPLLANRAKSMVGDNPYLSDYADKLGVSKTSGGSTTRMTGPDGKLYDVPNNRVQDFIKAGGKQSFNSVGGDTNQATIPSGTLASTNNNPGNLRYAGQEGAVPGKGGFAQFASVENGVKALKNQIKLDASRGLTLTSFITKYAPPKENNTKEYIAQIVQATGATPDTPIAQIDTTKLARAIAKKESGTTL